MALLGFRKSLEPVCDLGESLGSRGLGHARIHVRVLVGFAGDGGLEIQQRVTDGQIRSGIAYALQVVEMAVGVARFAICGLLEIARNLRVPLDIRDLREIEVTPIRLAFTGESILRF